MVPLFTLNCPGVALIDFTLLRTRLNFAALFRSTPDIEQEQYINWLVGGYVFFLTHQFEITNRLFSKNYDDPVNYYMMLCRVKMALPGGVPGRGYLDLFHHQSDTGMDKVRC